MIIGSLFCIGLGIFYRPLYALLPYPVHFEPYTAYHIWESLQVLLFTQLGFFLLLKMLWCENTISIDTDWIPRKVARAFLWLVNKPLASVEYNFIGEIYEFIVQKPIMKIAHLVRVFDTKAVDGTVNGIGKGTVSWGRLMQVMQSGQLQHYALVMAIGVLAVIALMFFYF
jgi:multicomponent Na+:H+ antiporter subunit D